MQYVNVNEPFLCHAHMMYL